MENLILYSITLIVTWLMGIFAKRNKYISTHLIPVQNLLIGIIITIIYWIISKDFEAALMLTGSLAGGLYDIVHNLQKLTEIQQEEQNTFNEDDLELIDTEADIIGDMEEEEVEILANETDEEEVTPEQEAIKEVIAEQPEIVEEGEN